MGEGRQTKRLDASFDLNLNEVTPAIARDAFRRGATDYAPCLRPWSSPPGDLYGVGESDLGAYLHHHQSCRTTPPYYRATTEAPGKEGEQRSISDSETLCVRHHLDRPTYFCTQ